MQIAINISHNLYESVLKGYDLSELGHHELYKAVQNGKPLEALEQKPKETVDNSAWDFHWDGRGSYEQERASFYGDFS